MDILDKIPKEFFRVEYNYDSYPGNADKFQDGANCQHFIYEVLRLFDYKIEDLRSSELMEDTVSTKLVEEMIPLDIVLLHSKEESYGAHVGLCISEKQEILHLSKSNNIPKIEFINVLMENPKYKYLIGIKRLIRKKSHL